MVSFAIGNNNIINRILIIGGLNDEEGSLEVFSQISSIIAVVVLIVELLKTLRNGISVTLVLN